MSGDLIEQLRRAALNSARGLISPEGVSPLDGPVTCGEATDLDDRWDLWCAQVHEGHRCRWNCTPRNRGNGPGGRGTHPGYRHECGCGQRWGSGL